MKTKKHSKRHENALFTARQFASKHAQSNYEDRMKVQMYKNIKIMLQQKEEELRLKATTEEQKLVPEIAPVTVPENIEGTVTP